MEAAVKKQTYIDNTDSKEFDFCLRHLLCSLRPTFDLPRATFFFDVYVLECLSHSRRHPESWRIVSRQMGARTSPSIAYRWAMARRDRHLYKFLFFF